MSSVASPDQPAAAHGPDLPCELVHVFLYCGFPIGKPAQSWGSAGKRRTCRGSAADRPPPSDFRRSPRARSSVPDRNWGPAGRPRRRRGCPEACSSGSPASPSRPEACTRLRGRRVLRLRPAEPRPPSPMPSCSGSSWRRGGAPQRRRTGCTESSSCQRRASCSGSCTRG